MPNLSQTELSRVLALEPGEDADAAFAEHVMGWSEAETSYGGEYWLSGERLTAKVEYEPTQGNTNNWWAGVEKLRERFAIVISTVADESGRDCWQVLIHDLTNYSKHRHANPAVVLLRAAVEAMYATQEGGK